MCGGEGVRVSMCVWGGGAVIVCVYYYMTWYRAKSSPKYLVPFERSFSKLSENLNPRNSSYGD